MVNIVSVKRCEEVAYTATSGCWLGTMGEGWIETRSHPALCCHDHCAFCMVRGHHPLGGQGLGRNLEQAYVPIQARFNT